MVLFDRPIITYKIIKPEGSPFFLRFYFFANFQFSVFTSGEIDRCLKKVQEGVETFEDIWQKVSLNN